MNGPSPKKKPNETLPVTGLTQLRLRRTVVETPHVPAPTVLPTAAESQTVQPSFTFVEENLTVLDNGAVIEEPSGSFMANVQPNKPFQLIDISTGLPTGGTMTQQELLDAIYSLYIAEYPTA